MQCVNQGPHNDRSTGICVCVCVCVCVCHALECEVVASISKAAQQTQ